MKAGANAVKIEGGNGHSDIIHHIVESGVPVMGHLGLTPQSVNMIGGWRVQGKTKEMADQLIQDAKDLEKAGTFALVLEMVPADLAKNVTHELTIPTIGIGAGSHTSGQVLVFQDMLGMDSDFNPTFLRKYMDGFSMITGALNEFNRDVKSNEFPNDEESF